MTEYSDSRRSSPLDPIPSDPQQRSPSSGSFALRRALYFQRNLLSFQRNGTESAALYRTASNVHELFP